MYSYRRACVHPYEPSHARVLQSYTLNTNTYTHAHAFVRVAVHMCGCARVHLHSYVHREACVASYAVHIPVPDPVGVVVFPVPPSLFLSHCDLQEVP